MTPSPPFHLELLRAAHFDSLCAVFDAVCRERRFLAFTEAAPKSVAFAYYDKVVSAGHSHFVAVRDDGQVLGWCDVLPVAGQMRSHTGVLGMGVAAGARGQGVGRALIDAAIGKAEARGLTRIELTVHAENAVARALYESVGFVQAGRQRRAWRVDGRDSDSLCMARLAGPAP